MSRVSFWQRLGSRVCRFISNAFSYSKSNPLSLNAQLRRLEEFRTWLFAKKRDTRRNRLVGLGIESLETRQMWAVDVRAIAIFDDVLKIQGTSRADHITLGLESNQVVATINQEVHRFAASDVARVEIRSLGGNDRIIASPNFSIPLAVWAGAGNDVIRGGKADDLLHGEAGNDLIVGRSGNDSLIGGAGDDRLYGGAGKDVLSGGRGADYLSGGRHADRLYGDDGADQLLGGAGADEIRGGDGADLILGGSGSDSLHGGRGADTIVSNGQTNSSSSAIDKIWGNQGDDTIKARTQDVVAGGAGQNTIQRFSSDSELLQNTLAGQSTSNYDLFGDLQLTDLSEDPDADSAFFMVNSFSGDSSGYGNYGYGGEGGGGGTGEYGYGNPVFWIEAVDGNNAYYQEGTSGSYLRIRRDMSQDQAGRNVYLSYWGSATEYTDFDYAPTSVWIGDGVEYVDIWMQNIDDNVDEGGLGTYEYVAAYLQDGSDYDVGYSSSGQPETDPDGDPSSAIYYIEDNDSYGDTWFWIEPYTPDYNWTQYGTTVSENSGTTSLFVIRRANSGPARTLNVSFSGQAEYNTDYTDPYSYVTGVYFPEGQTSITLDLSIIDDDHADPGLSLYEEFTATLNGGSGYNVGYNGYGYAYDPDGDPANAYARIEDNDAYGNTTFWIEAAVPDTNWGGLQGTTLPENATPNGEEVPVFVIRRSVPGPARTLTVYFSGEAELGVDYTDPQGYSSSVYFPEGATEVTLNLSVVNDQLNENGLGAFEEFSATLATAADYQVGYSTSSQPITDPDGNPAVAYARIQNDDYGSSVFWIEPAAVDPEWTEHQGITLSEGATPYGTTTPVFVIRREEAGAAKTLYVTFSGVAQHGVDYTDYSYYTSSVYFPENVTEVSLDLSIIDDGEAEVAWGSYEEIVATLQNNYDYFVSHPSSGLPTTDPDADPGTAYARIQENDYGYGAVTFWIEPYAPDTSDPNTMTLAENVTPAGEDTPVFVVRRAEPGPQRTVHVSIFNGEAILGDDYNLLQDYSNVVFPAGETSVEVRLNVVNDRQFEGGPGTHEDLTASLTVDADAYVSSSYAYARIEDDDLGTFWIEAASPDLNWGEKLGTTFSESATLVSVFTIRREYAGPAVWLTVSLDGIATAGVDFIDNPGASIYFPEGQTEVTLYYDGISDDLFEGGWDTFEEFWATLHSTTGIHVGYPETGSPGSDPDGLAERAYARIEDDDYADSTFWIETANPDENWSAGYGTTLSENDVEAGVVFVVRRANPGPERQLKLIFSGAAVFNTDYYLNEFGPGSSEILITIPENATEFPVLLSVIDDHIHDRGVGSYEQLDVELIALDNNTTIGYPDGGQPASDPDTFPSRAHARIEDNDEALVDLDVDSNNNGVINEIDDPNEDVGQGLLLGKAMVFQMNLAHNGTDTDDLILSCSDGTVEFFLFPDGTGPIVLENNRKVWQIGSAEPPPEVIYIRGKATGFASVSLMLAERASGETLKQDYINATVYIPSVDLGVDSNNDTNLDITPNGPDDLHETDAPGKRMIVGVLEPVKLTHNLETVGVLVHEFVLTVTEPNLKFFTDPLGNDPIEFNGDTKRWNIANLSPKTKTIWMRAAAPILTTTLTLELYQQGGGILSTDEVIVSAYLPEIDLAVDSNNDGLLDPEVNGTDDTVEMNGVGAVVFVNSDNENGNERELDLQVNGAIANENDLREVLINILGIPQTAANAPGWSVKLKYANPNRINFYTDDKRANKIVYNDGITLDPAACFGQSTFLYVEGLKSGKVTLTLEVRGPDNLLITDEVELIVLKVDADVDSDNSAGPTGSPSTEDLTEENLEFTTEDRRVGKYIPANHDDTDEDGIGDFHDTEVNAFNNGFTPLVVNFGPLDLQKFPNAKFKIEYPHYPKENDINNDVLYADQELDANDYEQQLSGTNTALRIWRKDETAIRKAKDIKQNDEDKGDIVNFTEPTWYTASELGLSMDNNGNLQGILYIEGLHDTKEPSKIEVRLDFDRANDAPDADLGNFSDTLLVKVTRIDMDIDSDNTQDDLALPELKPSEDILEAHTNKPGKIIYSNILNQDGDNQLDFEDPQVVVNGDLKFGFTPIQITFPADMHNAQVRFGFEAGGVSGGFLTPGVRLWTKQIDQFRNASSIALDGDLIPNGEWFDVSKFDLEVSENSEHPTRWVTLYVEGMGATLDAQNDSRPTPITVEIDPVIRAGNGPNEHLGIFDTVMVTVTSADIDVDSDNTQRYGLPERNSTEEQIEHLKNDPQRPGKYVLLNQRNADNDGFLDSMDNQIDGGFFTPIVIQKPKSPPPAGGSGSGEADAALIPDYRFKLNYRETFLRLWNADADSERDPNPVSTGGHIVKSNTSYTWAELGGVEGQDTLILYVEGIEISPQVVGDKLQGQEAIKLEVYEYSAPEAGEEGSGGSGSTQLVAYDEVIVNVVNEVSVAVINKYAMEPNDPQKAWELKDPAEFRISRGTGNTKGALTVYFQVYLDSNDRRIASLSDYDAPKLNRTTDVTQVPNTSYYSVDIPEGQYFVDISFFPNQDSLAEWDEEIRLNLVQNPEYFVGMDIDQSLQNVPYNNPQPAKPFYYLAGQPQYGSNPNQDYPNRVSAFIIDSNSDISFPLNRNRDVESTGLTPAMQSNGTVAVGLQSGDVTFVLPLAPGGWGPTYNSDDNLRPLLPIQIDIPYGDTPTEISVKLNVGGIENDQDITFSAGPNGFPTSGSGYNFMVMAQKSLADKLTSGHYDYFATFNIKVGGETYTRTIRGKTEIVNRVDNALGMTDFGKRWWPEMLDRMIPTDGVNAINTSSGQDLSRTQQGLAAYFGQTLVRGDNTTAFYHGYNPVAPSEINNYIEFTSFENPSDTDEELFWRTGLQLSSAGLQADEDQASWALSGLEGDKQYQIFVTWEPGLDRASNAAYTMSGLREVGNTYSEEKTIIVNQKFTPGELIKNGKAWRLLGTYVATGTAEVILKTNSVAGGFADGLVHAGEVMVVSDWTYETPDGSYNYLNQGEMDENTNGYYKGLAGQTSDDLTLLAKTGTRYTFDEFGFLTLVQDRNENQTKFAYKVVDGEKFNNNDKRLLETVTSQGGLVTHYLFEEEHLDKILDFAGRETDYDIVGGLLEAIHEPSTATNSPVTNFAYFGQSEDYQLQTVTNARGDKTEIEYDSNAHRAKKITNPDSVGNPHSAQTIDGSIIIGERAWQVRPEFVSTLTSATAAKVFNEANGDLADNADEPVAKYTDARNNVWRYQLDQFGGVIFSSDPVNGPSVVWKTERREKDGLAKKFTEPAGGGGIDSLGALVTRYDYDERGNLNELIYADNTQESWEYNQQFAVMVQAKDQLSRESIYFLDSRGNVDFITINSNSYSGDGASSLTVRNSTEYTPTPDTISSLAGGLVTLIEQPSAAGGTVKTKYQYYGTGSGTSIGLVHYAHQAFDTILQQTTTYTYDAHANPHEVTDYRGNTTTYTYDKLDQLVSQQSPNGDAGSGATINSQYDDMGNLISREVVGILPKTYEYDGMGRAIKESHGSRVLTVSAYDANGNLVDNKKLVGNSKYAFTHNTYDDRNLLDEQKIADPKTGEYIASNYAMKYFYDVLGNVKEERSNRFKQNSSGNYVLDTNATNVVNQYSYDKLNRVISQGINTISTQSIVQATGYYADGQTEWSSVTDEDGVLRRTNFTYDDFGREIEVKLPDPDDGSSLSRPTTTKTYFDDGSLESETVQGRTTNYTYDKLGRLKTKELPAPGASAGGGAADHGRPKFTYTYTVVGSNLEVVEKDPRGNDTKTIHDANDRLYQKIQPSANTGHAVPTTTYHYYSFGEIESVSIPVINEVGGTTVVRNTNYAYDDYGFLDYVTTPQGQLDYSYDAAGNKIAALDYNNNATTYDYDFHANLIKITQPTVAAGTPITEYEYDTAGNQTKAAVPGPAFGETGPKQLISNFTYDAFQRQISSADHLGQTTTNEYYLTGELKKQTISTTAGTADDRVTSYKYDRLGRQTEIINPLNEKTKFAYNDQGLLLTLTDSANNTTEYGYDDLGRKITETTDVQREYGGTIITAARHLHYDANGNVVQYKNRDGEIQKFKYDALNRRYEESWENVLYAAMAGYVASWKYNEVGEVLSGSDTRNSTAISDYDYEYNVLGQRRNETFSYATPQQTISGQWNYDYDSNGNRNLVKLQNTGLGADYQQNYLFNSLNWVTRMTHSDNSSNPNSNQNLKAQTVLYLQYLNGISRTELVYNSVTSDIAVMPSSTTLQVSKISDYDQLGRLYNREYKDDSGYRHYGYTLYYDAKHPALISQQTENTSHTENSIYEYRYDDAGQLIRQNFYPINGNPITQKFGYNLNGQQKNGLYGVDNRLFFDGLSWYQYDLEGRRVQEDQASSLFSRTVDASTTESDHFQIVYNNSAYVRSDSNSDSVNGNYLYFDQYGGQNVFRYSYLPADLGSTSTIQPGTYRFSTTWTALTNFEEDTAVNIQIRGFVPGSSTGTVLASRIVDQSKQPHEQAPSGEFYGYLLGQQAWQTVSLNTTESYSKFTIEISRVFQGNPVQYPLGNLIGDATKVERVTERNDLAWDPRNRLVNLDSQYNGVANSTQKYIYDVNDRLINTTLYTLEPGQSPQSDSYDSYIYDGQQIVFMEEKIGGTINRSHLLWQAQAIDQLVSINSSTVGSTGSTLDFVFSNQVGTPVFTLAENALFASDRISLDAYGNLSSSSSNQLRGFYLAGQRYDNASGLYYSRARWFDGQSQIFVSQDPMGFSAGDTNLYRRANNDPVNSTDPSGHFITTLIGAGVGAFTGGIIALTNGGNWNDILAGAGKGALIGAAVGSGVGIVGGMLGLTSASAATFGAGTLMAGASIGAARSIATTAMTNPNASFGDFALDGLMGAGSGLANPYGEFAGAAGSALGYAADRALGGNGKTGFLAGGLVGDVLGSAYGASKLATLRGANSAQELQKIKVALAFEATGSIGGAVAGGMYGGIDGALMGANIGRAAGNMAFGLKELYMPACFAAGTPIWGEFGAKSIEEFKSGERVWSRSELDPSAPLQLREIEEVFERYGAILELHLGGQVILTTAEHPFYVQGRGWVAAGELTEHELLVLHDGNTLPVETIRLTNEFAKVYNFRVAEYHTYFVGDPETWGWAVWAHNRYQLDAVSQLAQSDKGARASLRRAMGGVPEGQQAHHMIPWELRDHPIMQLAAQGGFGINSRANGILLDISVHLGSHPKYTTAILSKLDSLAMLGLNANQAAAQVQQYTARLFSGLSRTTSKLH